MFTFPTRSGTYRHGHQGYAVIDLETTGFDAAGRDRIVEIGIVRIDAFGRELGVFETLVNPMCPMRATGVHGIDAAMVDAAPTFAEVAASMLAWLDGVVVVAHNARFEAAFLSAELRRAGLAVPSLPGLDTLPLAQTSLPLPNHRLATVCGWAGVEITAAHTALGDALATAQMVPALLRTVGDQRWRAPMPRLGYSVSGGYLPRDHRVAV